MMRCRISRKRIYGIHGEVLYNEVRLIFSENSLEGSWQ